MPLVDHLLFNFVPLFLGQTLQISGHGRPMGTASLDGNTVEINTENSLFTENSMRYQATNTFLNSKIKGVMSALRGE